MKIKVLKRGNLEVKWAIYRGACVLDLEYLYVGMNELVYEFEMSYLRQNIWVCRMILQI